MKILAIKSLMVMCLMFFAANFLVEPARADIISPLIINVKADSYSGARPTITGVQPADADVLIYINGIFFGEAETMSRGNQTDSFYFRLEENLRAGTNLIQAVSRDRVSKALSRRSDVFVYQVRALSAPMLIGPDNQAPSSQARPLITGLSNSGAKVRFWIDGVYNGQTDFVYHPSGTGNFSYRPFLNLSPGRHFVAAQAIDVDGARSSFSELKEIVVEEPLPAPILIGVVEKNFNGQKFFLLTGLSKNDLQIRVYIDRIERGYFQVSNHPSQTANFYFQSSVLMKPGQHLIYAEAVDRRKKVSPWSNQIVFSRPNPPLITDQAASSTYSEISPDFGLSKIDAEEIVDQGKAFDNDNQKEKTDSQTDEQNNTAPAINISATGTDQELAALVRKLNQPENQEEQANNEAQQRKSQARLRINLLIFIGFLLAVIGWVAWVNRTLLKEKQNNG